MGVRGLLVPAQYSSVRPVATVQLHQVAASHALDSISFHFQSPEKANQARCPHFLVGSFHHQWLHLSTEKKQKTQQLHFL